MKTNQTTTYRQAMAELTRIVNQLRDSENVDVDELVTNVARAKELIHFCDGKIQKADAAIKGIVSELQTTEETSPASSSEWIESPNGNKESTIPF